MYTVLIKDKETGLVLIEKVETTSEESFWKYIWSKYEDRFIHLDIRFLGIAC